MATATVPREDLRREVRALSAEAALRVAEAITAVMAVERKRSEISSKYGIEVADSVALSPWSLDTAFRVERDVFRQGCERFGLPDDYFIVDPLDPVRWWSRPDVLATLKKIAGGKK